MGNIYFVYILSERLVCAEVIGKDYFAKKLVGIFFYVEMIDKD